MINDPIARARECASRIPPNGTFLEIGVWRGANAARVLKQRPDVTAVLVDPWQAATGSYATSGSSDSRLTQSAFDATYRTALHNLSPYVGRYVAHRMTSADAAALLKDVMIDVVFIDGDHSYEGCSRDIELWRGRATRFIGGHDYGKDSFPGVTRAVHEAFKGWHVLGADSTWWYEC